MKNLIIFLVVLLVLAVGGYFFYQTYTESVDTGDDEVLGGLPSNTLQRPEEPVVEEEEEEIVLERPQGQPETLLGTSVQGGDIKAYHYGSGDTEIMFIGGLHGGYEWNTVLLAYQLMDYFDANPNVIPSNVKVTVVPVVNPDGLNKVVGSTGRFSVSDVPTSAAATVPGRYNANNVDLNRNFDCDWQASGVWQDKTVSGGSAAFSEPESKALARYIETNKPAAVVVYYSAVGGVFASNCHNGILPDTSTLTNLYAQASGYRAYQEFDYYAITGDAVNWMAKKNIPAISVLLTTHQDTEWAKNKAGAEAVLKHYAQ